MTQTKPFIPGANSEGQMGLEFSWKIFSPCAGWEKPPLILRNYGSQHILGQD